MSDEISVCPECGSHRLHRRVPGIASCAPEDGRVWYCEECEERYTEPAHRERKIQSSGLSGLPRRLADADPDEVLP